MQSVEMPGLDRQDPAVERLGLGQAAGLMQVQLRLEERRDVGRARRRDVWRLARPAPERLSPALRLESRFAHGYGRASGSTAKLWGDSPRCARSHMAV